MEEPRLPEKMFQTGYEPHGKKRINNYFNLRWIEIIKQALDDEHLQMLAESQFSHIMQMGHHTFSVMFVHFLLSRQLITDKKYELWWVYCGKPIRYAVEDFGFATGLNYAQPARVTRREKLKGKTKGKGKGKAVTGDGDVWDSLFGKEKKPTTAWILERLIIGKKYKDSLTRFRLALLLLVEGILCPTSGTPLIRTKVVDMVADLEAFLKYPWGRESFLLTVNSANARTPAQYAQDTTAIQGFAHAIVLVTICCCPEIIAKPGGLDPIIGYDVPIEDILQSLIERSLVINVITAKNLDKIGQAEVRSILRETVEGEGDFSSFPDEDDDASVDYMVSLIADGYPFEHNTWEGGVTADEAADPVKNLGKTVADDEDVSDGGKDQPVKKMRKTVADDQDVNDGGKGQKPHTNLDDGHGMEDVTKGNAGVPNIDIPLLLRKVADAYEERCMGMFEGYTVNLKDHLDASLRELRRDMFSMVRSLGNKISAPRNASIGDGSEFTGETHEEYCGNKSPVVGDTNPIGLKDGFLDMRDGGALTEPQGIPSRSTPGKINGEVEDVIEEVCNWVKTNTNVDETVHAKGTFEPAQKPNYTIHLSDEAPPPFGPTFMDAETDEAPMPMDSEAACVEKKQQHENGRQADGLDSSVEVEKSATGVATATVGVRTIDGGASVAPPPIRTNGLAQMEKALVAEVKEKVIGNTKVVDHSKVSPDADSLEFPAPLFKIGLTQIEADLTREREMATKQVCDVRGGTGKEIVCGPRIPIESGAAKQLVETEEIDEDEVPIRLRASKRQRTSPVKYTPPVTRPRTTKTNKKVKHKKGDTIVKSNVSDQEKPSEMAKTTNILTELIGGFKPFSPPKPPRSIAFLKVMERATKYTIAEGVEVENIGFIRIFESQSFLEGTGPDALVKFMQIRRDTQKDSRFDFLPFSFISELLSQYNRFIATEDRDKFFFSSLALSAFNARPLWFEEVDVIYCPMQIERKHWVGIVIDLKKWSLEVLDCNTALVTAGAILSTCRPISVMLPYFIRRHGVTAKMQAVTPCALKISRADIPFLCELTGLVGVSTMVLLELHAIGQIDRCAYLRVDELRAAAENYAIESFSALQPSVLPA